MKADARSLTILIVFAWSCATFALASPALLEQDSASSTEATPASTLTAQRTNAHTAALVEGVSNSDTEMALEISRRWDAMETYMFKVRIALIFFGAFVAAAFYATYSSTEASSSADAPPSAEDVNEEESQLPLAVALDASAFLPQKLALLSDIVSDAESPFLLPVDDDRQTLTYARLREFLNSGDADISRFGVAGDERLGALIGSGPEAAVALFAFSAQCAFAPVNPNLSNDELVFELSDLPVKAVVALPQYAQRPVGDKPVIVLEPNATVAGLFSLRGEESLVPRCMRDECSIALVLHTSGTTKKPKLVPITHEALVLGSRCIRETLELTVEDQCLNMLPLFHIGGLICNILGTATAGASVICAPHFKGNDAVRWLKAFRPTWYYAGPTSHIMMMNQEEKPPNPGSLTFARNATAALLPSVAAQMKEVFGCIVLPTYGMSECNPIASHRRSALVRLIGVGPSAGPEIRISDVNEILIRAPHCFSGYDVREHMSEDPNIEAFKDGWFHTGDCGGIDDDGYLFLTGRQKELINRGGEKISPLEVEDSVSDPRVIERVAFAVPHEELGEVVGLAVRTDVRNEHLFELFTSIRKSCNLTEKWLPEVIVKVKEFPKGNTGKLLRIGLAKKLGVPACSASRAGLSAYAHDANGLVTVHQEAGTTIDSLGFVQKKGGQEAEEKELCMAVYAILVFSVVVSHQVRQLHVNRHFTTWSTVGFLALDADPVDCTKWTLTGIVACTAYLSPKGPLQWHRLIALVVVYCALVWPIHPMVVHLHALVSGQDPHMQFAWINQRYFVAVVIIAQILFAGARHLPRPDLQCLTLVAFTVVLAIVNPRYHVFTEHAPALVNFWFDLTPHHGWQAWGVWLTIYFTVSYYGQDFITFVKSHRLAKDERLQGRLSALCAVLLLGALMWQMSGAWWVIEHAKNACTPNRRANCRVLMDIDMTAKYNRHFSAMGPRLVWLVVESISGLVFVALLVVAARGAKWLGAIGYYGFGIYCAHNLWYVHGGSFAIIVRGFTILPQLQDVLEAASFTGAFQVVIVGFYAVCQMVFTGVPFFCLYLLLLRLVQDGVRFSRYGMPLLGMKK